MTSIKKSCDALWRCLCGMGVVNTDIACDSKAVKKHDPNNFGHQKLEYYKSIREYRITEHHLLNHRLTWNLNIQGFLFATYGFCAQKFVEDPLAINHAVYQVRLLMIVIPLVGLFLSVIVLFAVVGAIISLRKLQDEWREIDDVLPLYAPDPCGGGSKLAVYLGYLPPTFIPPVFAIAWAVLWYYF